MQFKRHQKAFIVKHLKRHKRISRNFCLNQGITRLSSYICQLSKEGWIFETPDHRQDRDFRYLLIKEPKTVDK